MTRGQRDGRLHLDLEHHVRRRIDERGAVSCYWDYAPSFGSGPFRNVICLSVNDAVLHGLPTTTVVGVGDAVDDGQAEADSGVVGADALGAALERFGERGDQLGVELFAGVVDGELHAVGYVLQLDRVSSVDDVLLNAAGAGLAALASRPWWRTAAGASAPARPTTIAPVPGR